MENAWDWILVMFFWFFMFFFVSCSGSYAWSRLGRPQRRIVSNACKPGSCGLTVDSRFTIELSRKNNISWKCNGKSTTNETQEGSNNNNEKIQRQMSCVCSMLLLSHNVRATEKKIIRFYILSWCKMYSDLLPSHKYIYTYFMCVW